MCASFLQSSHKMTTVARHMIVLGLLFWTSSSAEQNFKSVYEATDDLTNEEKHYRRSEENHLSFESQAAVNAREPYSMHERTTRTDGKRHSANHDLHSSASPRNFRAPTSLERNHNAPDERIDLQTSKLHQPNFESGDGRTKRSIDDDSIDLVEPKNDIDIGMTNEKILETAHEMSGFDYYSRITPTKTKLHHDVGDEMSKSEMVLLTGSGEDQRASSRGRSLPLAEPNSARSASSATATGNEATLAARSGADDRQSNSDIQNIIDGFVKLLNGNVQVQVNTNGSPGKPNFPSRTRINNRGPPRITDVPPIVFEPPVQIPPNIPPAQLSSQAPSTSTTQPSREPPPYPFDIPQSLPAQPVLRPFVSGVPLPEQVVPTNSAQKVATTNHTHAVNESSVKEPPKVVKDKTPTNSSGMSVIEKVNKTQIKSTPSQPVLSPVFVPSQSVEVKANVSSPQDSQGGFDDSRVDPKPGKWNISQMAVKQNGTKSASSTFDIQPSPTLPPSAKTSAPPVVSAPPTEVSDSATGVGSAVVVLEPSTQEVAGSAEVHKASASIQAATSSVGISSSNVRKRPTAPITNGSSNGYFPRPGIVLDDPEYKPGAHRRPPPIISAPPAKPSNNRDIFDVTVSAIQGTAGSDNSSKTGLSYVIPVDIDPAQVDSNHNEVPVITNPQAGQNFVSIDGKRTYMNLFDSTAGNTGLITPTLVKNYPGSSSGSNPSSQVPVTKTVPTKSPPIWKKPTHPPVRIDTCIVGDDSTCDSSQHERCRTEVGVSSCHCRPGYTRRKHREPCHRIVSLSLSLRVDRMYDQHLSWNDKLAENDSAEYQQLEFEAGKAIDSALSMTPFSDVFMGARVNNIYTSRNSNIASPVFVNMTVQLAESQETLRPPVKQDLQKHLMGVIQRRSNNVGSSALWVDNPNGAVSQIHDVDECSSPDLNDCHPAGKCTNIFGSFHCTCPEGYRDPWGGNNHRSGRTCETCDAGHCNHRGDCSFHNGQPVCRCTGSFYGAQCEIDGEVLGVAVGSSLVAILIIITTLACLCAWSRRWSKEQKIGSPIFGYMPSGGSTVKTPVMGAPPYQVSLEDRLRWAQLADAMAHANHYGPEPVNPPTRPSSTIFGYTLPHSAGPVIMPRLRPPSVHTLRTPESSTSEEEDRADLLGRNFQVPRPKSRSSIANQSGIYYDVDYDSQQQSGEIFSTIKSGQPCIPLNTYTMGSRSHYFNFRS